jgi:hypothetical protein
MMIINRMWMILPVRGIPVLTLGPKNPSNQSSNKMMIIVSSIISLFLCLVSAIQSRMNAPHSTRFTPFESVEIFYHVYGNGLDNRLQASYIPIVYQIFW